MSQSVPKRCTSRRGADCRRAQLPNQPLEERIADLSSAITRRVLATAIPVGSLFVTEGALAVKPEPDCDDRTICTALFYCNDNDPDDLPVINQHQLVVFNQDWQLDDLLEDVDEDVLVVYYHLLDFCVQDGPFYQWSTVNAESDWFLTETVCPYKRIKFPGVPINHWYMDVANEDYFDFKVAQYENILSY